jgi:hypothetical protein
MKIPMFVHCAVTEPISTHNYGPPNHLYIHIRKMITEISLARNSKVRNSRKEHERP